MFLRTLHARAIELSSERHPVSTVILHLLLLRQDPFQAADNGNLNAAKRYSVLHHAAPYNRGVIWLFIVVFFEISISLRVYGNTNPY